MPATISKAVSASAGTAVMPGAAGPVSIPVWGYAIDPSPGLIPGQTLEATVGDTLQVVLHNTLAEPVSMIFPGQDLVPNPVKDPQGRIVSFTDHAEPGQSVTYSFQVSRPGTYGYESGSSPQRQVPMGLCGALIVRPVGFNPADPGTWTVYGLDTRSEYDREGLLILAEIDSELCAAVAAGLPYDMLDYRPDWWTINGRSFPDTLAPDDSSSQGLGARITGSVGERILLRCVNAGFLSHSLHFGGLSGRVVGADGRPLATPTLDGTYEKLTLTIAPGQTYEVILSPATPGEFYVWDRHLNHTLNEGEFPGGMMTRLEISP